MKIIKEQALNNLSEALTNLRPKEVESKEDRVARLGRTRTLLKSAIHLISKL